MLLSEYLSLYLFCYIISEIQYVLVNKIKVVEKYIYGFCACLCIDYRVLALLGMCTCVALGFRPCPFHEVETLYVLLWASRLGFNGPLLRTIVLLLFFGQHLF